MIFECVPLERIIFVQCHTTDEPISGVTLGKKNQMKALEAFFFSVWAKAFARSCYLCAHAVLNNQTMKANMVNVYYWGNERWDETTDIALDQNETKGM